MRRQRVVPSSFPGSNSSTRNDASTGHAAKGRGLGRSPGASTACRVAAITVIGLTAMYVLGGAGDDQAPSRARKMTADPCAVALSAQSGSSPMDADIQGLQQQIRKAKDRRVKLERLGWLFVAMARVSNDPGYYNLAAQAAACLSEADPGSAAARLLRGHVLHNQHRFQEAEVVARELVATRKSPFDYGLLGDVLMEQGRLEEAADAYQTMVDLKPGLQSYSRAAHLRWLKGDLPGAIELMGMAARAGGPRNAEAVAWAYSRLAIYQLQAGSTGPALRASDAALEFQPDYAPALLARGRILLAQGHGAEAIEALSRATELNPLPEYQWCLADALRAEGAGDEAAAIESELIKHGPRSDPRTYSLFLATRGQHPEAALRLARSEMDARADVFTLDALAWSLTAAGKIEEARAVMDKALAEGTQDARLFFHAGMIARATGQRGEAIRHFKKAHSMQQTLFPSERDQLTAALSLIG